MNGLVLKWGLYFALYLAAAISVAALPAVKNAEWFAQPVGIGLLMFFAATCADRAGKAWR